MKKGKSFSLRDTNAYCVLNSEAKIFIKYSLFYVRNKYV